VNACRIDAVDKWCLRTLLGIKPHQFVRNEEVRRITKQPNLTVIIQSWRLSIFGHIARMDDDAHAKMILMAPPPENWNSVVMVAGICNSVSGGVLFNIPPRWRWRISVQYAPGIAGEGQSSVPFPSPHASSCRTRQLLPSLLITRRRDAIVMAVVPVDRSLRRSLVQQRTSRLIALAV